MRGRRLGARRLAWRRTTWRRSATAVRSRRAAGRRESPGLGKLLTAESGLGRPHKIVRGSRPAAVSAATREPPGWIAAFDRGVAAVRRLIAQFDDRSHKAGGRAQIDGPPYPWRINRFSVSVPVWRLPWRSSAGADGRERDFGERRQSLVDEPLKPAQRRALVTRRLRRSPAVRKAGARRRATVRPSRGQPSRRSERDGRGSPAGIVRVLCPGWSSFEPLGQRPFRTIDRAPGCA